MKKLLATILLFALPVLAFAGQNQLDTDVFGGVAATNLHTYNANWVTSTFATTCNDNKISTPNGGVVGAGGTSCDSRIGFTPTNDQYDQSTIGTLATSAMFIAVRLTNTGTTLNGGYCAGTDPNVSGNNKYTLVKCTALNTPLKTSATVALAGDVVNLQVVGSTITVTVNGVVLSDMTTVDASFTTGLPGYVMTDTTGKFTTWSAGSVTGGAVKGCRFCSFSRLISWAMIIIR